MRLPVVLRFLSKLSKDSNGCINWTGGGHKGSQYGRICHRGNKYLTHRFSWSVLCGREIPNGMELCHRCDNTRCVNVDHLFLGTHADNMLDCKTKGRYASIKGENQSASKLKESQVLDIKRRLELGESGRSLAREFSVSATCIYYIRSGRLWGWLSCK